MNVIYVEGTSQKVHNRELYERKHQQRAEHQCHLLLLQVTADSG